MADYAKRIAQGKATADVTVPKPKAKRVSKTQRLEAENAILKAENADTKARLLALEARLSPAPKARDYATEIEEALEIQDYQLAADLALERDGASPAKKAKPTVSKKAKRKAIPQVKASDLGAVWAVCADKRFRVKFDGKPDADLRLELCKSTSTKGFALRWEGSTGTWSGFLADKAGQDLATPVLIFLDGVLKSLEQVETPVLLGV